MQQEQPPVEEQTPTTMQIVYADPLAHFPKHTIRSVFGKHEGVVLINLHTMTVTVSHTSNGDIPAAAFPLFFNESAQGRCINEWMQQHEHQFNELTEIFFIEPVNGIPTIKNHHGTYEKFSHWHEYQNSIGMLQRSLDMHVINSQWVWNGEYEASDAFDTDLFDKIGTEHVILNGKGYKRNGHENHAKICAAIHAHFADKGEYVTGIKPYLHGVLRTFG